MKNIAVLATFLTLSCLVHATDELDNFELDSMYIGDHSWKTLVKDQGNFGACAAFSVSECVKYVNGAHVNPLLTYFRFIELTENMSDEGAPLESVMYYARDCGLPREGALRDYKLQYTLTEDEENNRNAFEHILQQYKRHIDNSKISITYGFREVGCVFDERLQALESGGKIVLIKNALKTHKVPISVSAPTVINGEEWCLRKPINERTVPITREGWHAITIFGFNEFGFLFKNSWGLKDKNGDDIALHENGLSCLSYESATQIRKAYFGKGIKVFRNGCEQESVFGPFRAYEKSVHISQRITIDNVYNLIEDLQPIRKSIQYIRGDGALLDITEEAKTILKAELDNQEYWPGIKRKKSQGNSWMHK